ncbi:MAG: cell wall hydrolase [Candidatus Brocadiaceae bacterium]|nr:cell wall hydrolase [Candidatus Brocadiaceae bacterium]
MLENIWAEEKEEPRLKLPENKDIALLARVIFAEAAGESIEGKRAVAWVVRNRVRVRSRRRKEFGSIYGWDGVILKRDAFAGVQEKLWWKLEDIDSLNLQEQEALKECIEVAEEVYEGMGIDPTDGALFFHKGWPREGDIADGIERGEIISTRRRKIGKHYFFKYKE